MPGRDRPIVIGRDRHHQPVLLHPPLHELVFEVEGFFGDDRLQPLRLLGVARPVRLVGGQPNGAAEESAGERSEPRFGAADVHRVVWPDDILHHPGHGTLARSLAAPEDQTQLEELERVLELLREHVEQELVIALVPPADVVEEEVEVEPDFLLFALDRLDGQALERIHRSFRLGARHPHAHFRDYPAVRMFQPHVGGRLELALGLDLTICDLHLKVVRVGHVNRTRLLVHHVHLAACVEQTILLIDLLDFEAVEQLAVVQDVLTSGRSPASHRFNDQPAQGCGLAAMGVESGPAPVALPGLELPSALGPLVPKRQAGLSGVVVVKGHTYLQPRAVVRVRVNMFEDPPEIVGGGHRHGGRRHGGVRDGPNAFHRARHAAGTPRVLLPVDFRRVHREQLALGEDLDAVCRVIRHVRRRRQQMLPVVWGHGPGAHHAFQRAVQMLEPVRAPVTVDVDHRVPVDVKRQISVYELTVVAKPLPDHRRITRCLRPTRQCRHLRVGEQRHYPGSTLCVQQRCFQQLFRSGLGLQTPQPHQVNVKHYQCPNASHQLRPAPDSSSLIGTRNHGKPPSTASFTRFQRGCQSSGRLSP